MTAGQISLDDLPLRDELRGAQPYGAPQLDVPVRLNVNENPYPPSDRCRRPHLAPLSQRAAATLNRYPDRDAVALRADLAAYLTADGGVGLGVDNVWAANGSNEIMLQLLQAFGGPGRTAVSFAPTYSMYPEYARDTHTEWVTGNRADDFTIDDAAALALIERRTARRGPARLAQQPDRYGVAAARRSARSAAAAPGIVVVDEAYAEFRRERDAERALAAAATNRGWS